MSVDGYDVTLSYKQILIWLVTAILLAAFWYLVSRTALGRAQRACEQDQKMAALLGINVDRTIMLWIGTNDGFSRLLINADSVCARASPSYLEAECRCCKFAEFSNACGFPSGEDEIVRLRLL